MYRTEQTTLRDRARQFFDSVRNEVPSSLRSENPIYLFPVGGFGEVTYTLTLSPNLRQINRVVLVMPQQLSWITKFFPNAFDFVVSYKSDYSNLVIELFDISASRPDYPLVVRPDLIGDGRFCNVFVLGSDRINYAEVHAYLMGLPLAAPLIVPEVGRIVEASGGVSEPSPNKLLVFHHANTMPALPKELWLSLFEKLSDKGFHVEFDKFGGALDDRLPTRTVLGDDLMRLSSDYAYVVTLRSGLSDLIASTFLNTKSCLITLYNTLPNVNAHQRVLCKPGVSRTGIAIHQIWKHEKFVDIEVASVEAGVQSVLKAMDFLGKFT